MLVIKINYLLREDALRHLWATFATQAKHGGVVALPPYCTLLYAGPGDNQIKVVDAEGHEVVAEWTEEAQQHGAE